MLVDTRNADYSSTVKIDQVLRVYSGSVSIPNTGGIFTDSRINLKAHGLGETCLVKGIVSFDGGSTWQDQFVFSPVTGAPLGVFIYPAVFTDQLAIIAATTAAVTMLYRLLLIAKPGQSRQDPPTGLFSNTIFSSKFNYQKIAFDVVGLFSSFTHNLGYIPKVSVWTDDTYGGNANIHPLLGGDPPIQVNSTQVYFGGGTPTTNIYFRVYYDG